LHVPEQQVMPVEQAEPLASQGQSLSEPSAKPSQSSSMPLLQISATGAPQSTSQLQLSSPPSHNPSPQQEGAGGRKPGSQSTGQLLRFSL
jgi:hypothetical protein